MFDIHAALVEEAKEQDKAEASRLKTRQLAEAEEKRVASVAIRKLRQLGVAKAELGDVTRHHKGTITVGWRGYEGTTQHCAKFQFQVGKRCGNKIENPTDTDQFFALLHCNDDVRSAIAKFLEANLEKELYYWQGDSKMVHIDLIICRSKNDPTIVAWLTPNQNQS